LKQSINNDGNWQAAAGKLANQQQATSNEQRETKQQSNKATIEKLTTSSNNSSSSRSSSVMDPVFNVNVGAARQVSQTLRERTCPLCI
jgi:hypothetical protein